MKNFKLMAAIAAATLACASAAAASPVPVTTTTFDFKGACGDCTGYGTGVLTVRNYTPGDAFQNFNLVDFSYTSNLATFDINPVADYLSNDTLTGSIGTAPGYYNVSVDSLTFGIYDLNFTSSSDGTWNVSQGIVSEDYGVNGVWNAGVPEPATWFLMLAGLGGVGVALRHAKRKALVLADAASA